MFRGKASFCKVLPSCASGLFHVSGWALVVCHADVGGVEYLLSADKMEAQVLCARAAVARSQTRVQRHGSSKTAEFAQVLWGSGKTRAERWLHPRAEEQTDTDLGRTAAAHLVHSCCAPAYDADIQDPVLLARLLGMVSSNEVELAYCKRAVTLSSATRGFQKGFNSHLERLQRLRCWTAVSDAMSEVNVADRSHGARVELGRFKICTEAQQLKVLAVVTELLSCTSLVAAVTNAFETTFAEATSDSASEAAEQNRALQLARVEQNKRHREAVQDCIVGEEFFHTRQGQSQSHAPQWIHLFLAFGKTLRVVERALDVLFGNANGVFKRSKELALQTIRDSSAGTAGPSLRGDSVAFLRDASLRRVLTNTKVYCPVFVFTGRSMEDVRGQNFAKGRFTPKHSRSEG